MGFTRRRPSLGKEQQRDPFQGWAPLSTPGRERSFSHKRGTTVTTVFFFSFLFKKVFVSKIPGLRLFSEWFIS